MRKDRTPMANMKKRAEEAEGELSIMKGIETNRVKEAQARCNHLQNELDRIKKENNDLFNRVADALEVNESHQKLNGKLQERLTELEEENKKMHNHLNKRIRQYAKVRNIMRVKDLQEFLSKFTEARCRTGTPSGQCCF